MAFSLPDLPYDYDALEPHMSAETLELHHGKHHKGYVNGLNNLLPQIGADDMPLEELIQQLAKRDDQQDAFNKAAQSWNHNFFWHCMTPDGGGEPSGELARQIVADFGSLKVLRSAFKSVATDQFGSGWAWLTLDNGRLKVMATANADLPMLYGHQALLTCDLWEHAYYLDYKNERGRFVETFLDNLVNWEFVAEQFANQGEGNATAARRYQDAQESFAGSGKVADAARDAADAMDSDEAEELEQARRQTGTTQAS